MKGNLQLPDVRARVCPSFGMVVVRVQVTGPGKKKKESGDRYYITSPPLTRLSFFFFPGFKILSVLAPNSWIW